MAIKTYEEVFSNTPVKKSGIKTYEDVFGAQPQAQPKENLSRKGYTPAEQNKMIIDSLYGGGEKALLVPQLHF